MKYFKLSSFVLFLALFVGVAAVSAQDADTSTTRSFGQNLSEQNKATIQEQAAARREIQESRVEAYKETATERNELVKEYANAETQEERDAIAAEADQMRTKLDAERRALYEESEAQREEIRAKRNEEVRAIVEERNREGAMKFVDIMDKQMETAIDWLKELSSRVDGSIADLESKGTKLPQSKLINAQAKGAIAIADSSVVEIERILDELLVSDSPQELMGNALFSVQKGALAVQEAQELLTETVETIKTEAVVGYYY